LESKNKRVEAVVVLGASQWNGRPSPMLKTGLNHTYRLYERGLDEYIISFIYGCIDHILKRLAKSKFRKWI